MFFWWDWATGALKSRPCGKSFWSKPQSKPALCRDSVYLALQKQWCKHARPVRLSRSSSASSNLNRKWGEKAVSTAKWGPKQHIFILQTAETSAQNAKNNHRCVPAPLHDVTVAYINRSTKNQLFMEKLDFRFNCIFGCFTWRHRCAIRDIKLQNRDQNVQMRTRSVIWVSAKGFSASVNYCSGFPAGTSELSGPETGFSLCKDTNQPRLVWTWTLSLWGYASIMQVGLLPHSCAGSGGVGVGA